MCRWTPPWPRGRARRPTPWSASAPARGHHATLWVSGLGFTVWGLRIRAPPRLSPHPLPLRVPCKDILARASTVPVLRDGLTGQCTRLILPAHKSHSIPGPSATPLSAALLVAPTCCAYMKRYWHWNMNMQSRSSNLADGAYYVLSIAHLLDSLADCAVLLRPLDQLPELPNCTHNKGKFCGDCLQLAHLQLPQVHGTLLQMQSPSQEGPGNPSCM